jgi:3-oxoacyl-[acyl-carrier-protein] synthase II
MEAKRTVILGYDAVSPLGVDLPEQWQRAIRGESGIGRLTRFPIRKNFPVLVAGEVGEIDDALYAFLRPRALAQWRSPIFKYAMLTVHRALKNSGIEITPEIAHRVAITFSSAVGGQDAVIEADRLLNAEEKLPHPSTNPNSCINMVGGKISILTQATGPITSTITACATGATSIIVGSMLIQQNKADVVICGAVDFALVEPIVAGFATMNGAYSCWEDGLTEEPAVISRPFSLNRKGFVIAEGSGAIIIASKEFAAAHGLHQRFELAGWGMTADAYHYVAPNLETVTRCMQEAITDAGITPGEIDVVNAHAASTKVGDKVEFEALQATFNRRVPPVSANKSLIGHAMGASSAIETIYGMEGMAQNQILPTINYQADPEIKLDCVPEGVRQADQEFMLKNAFGFGGCNACLVIKRVS